MSEEPHLLITGGEGGLAKAIVEVFSQAGWRVSAPSKEELDVRSASSVKEYFAGLSQLDSLDVLVNNAGVIEDASFAKMSEESWDQVFNVCLKGAFLCSQRAAALMCKQRSGHIVMIGSYAGLVGRYGQSNYAAAKAGLSALGKSLAAEYGSRNVRVNTVLPGFMETAFTDHLSEELVEKVLSVAVLKEPKSEPLSVAKFLLALQDLSQVSGQVFNLDSRIHS